VSNPVGIAAGFDKDAQAVDGLFDLGFGYVEVGSITPAPQPGNPKPRFFRLEEDDAAINRYGFNSLGHGQALARLRGRVAQFAAEHPSLFPDGLGAAALPPRGLPRSLRPGHLLGVNLGKNKTSAADSDDDYIRGVRTLGPYADVLVVNVSSPNTPGLRALQGREQLERLLSSVVEERNKIAVDGLPKLAVKVTCDLSEEELADVASAVRSTGVDGVIISNTTLRRDGLTSPYRSETGGLSGRPLFPYALASLRTLRPLLPPSIPIIGAGGVWTGDDALAMARAGASLVQIYTSFGYRGVGAPRLLKDEVSAALARAPAPDASWAAQIGRDFEGANMGWDEARVAAEAVALKHEAAALSELLADIQQREQAAAAVQAADAAMAEIKAQAEAAAAKAAQAAQEAAEGAAAAAAHVVSLILPESGEAAAPPVPLLEAPPAAAEPAQAVPVAAAAAPSPAPAPAPPSLNARPTPSASQQKFIESAQGGDRRLV
jgi:dihydroorotate dehydrogenase